MSAETYLVDSILELCKTIAHAELKNDREVCVWTSATPVSSRTRGAAGALLKGSRRFAWMRLLGGGWMGEQAASDALVRHMQVPCLAYILSGALSL